VDRDLGEDDGVLILDGSDFPKQGETSMGVKRQYCGELGQRANCQARVFLGYASRKGYTLLDRRRRCGVPQEITFTTKPLLGGR
jgi:SRSO17 transposase